MTDLLSTIDSHARSRPGDPALIGDHDRLCYGELPSRIEQYADKLRARGCRVAGLLMDNGPDWVLWDLAMIRAEIVCVPLPPFFSLEQQRHAIATAGIDHLITERGISEIASPGTVTALPGTAKITFTSGSTGTPKGVCLPQDGLDRVARSIVDAVHPQQLRRHLSVLPLGVLLENVAGVYAALFAGCGLRLPAMARLGFVDPFRPNFSRLVHFMRDEAVQSVILVPELLRGITAEFERMQIRLPDMQFLAVGGAKIAPDLIRRARALGLPVFEGYGLSECGSVISLNTAEHDRPGSAGRLLPHVDAIERRGEIVVRNPVFLGYLGEPHSGPFATGDRGSIDPDGFIDLQGRLRNVLITSFGRNISPEWVESALLDQPEIAQAVVYGDGLPYLEALIVATDASIDIAAAIARANRHLPEYARIDSFHAVPPFRVENGLLAANGRLRRDAILAAYQHVIAKENQDGLLRSTGP